MIKNCTTCKNIDVDSGRDPCYYCDVVQGAHSIMYHKNIYTHWEQQYSLDKLNIAYVDGEIIIKHCSNCRHTDVESTEKPCVSCDVRTGVNCRHLCSKNLYKCTNWEPQIKNVVEEKPKVEEQHKLETKIESVICNDKKLRMFS